MKSGFKISILRTISKFMSKLNNTCNVIVTILSVIKNNHTQKAKNVKKKIEQKKYR